MYVKCVNDWNHVNELFSEVPIKKADVDSATVGWALLIMYRT